MKPTWRGTLIVEPTFEQISAVLPEYEVMLMSILDAMLNRFERNPGYRFFDTKLSTITGLDFAKAADPERDFIGEDSIYGWIQGRGLEALAGHIEWLPKVAWLSPAEREDRMHRLRKMLASICDHLESLRLQNGGKLSFVMTPDGRPLERRPDGRRKHGAPDLATSTTTDLFYAKGLLAAAHTLGRTEKSHEAVRLFREVLHRIESETHLIDQISFDPKNVVAPQPGKRRHGPRMIAIYGCSVLAEKLAADEWLDTGARLIRHVLDRHVNHGQWPELKPFDMVEAIDPAGNPWRDHGTVLCDPGHVLEFVGLATRLLLLLQLRGQPSPADAELLARARAEFPKIFLQGYRHGFNREVGGICKAYDLTARAPLNRDMPWWSLPETLRAGAGLLVMDPDSADRAEILQVIACSSNAFFKNYVNPACHLMAYQTIDANGKPVAVIPATPDADPGYHSGLSIIDFIANVRRC